MSDLQFHPAKERPKLAAFLAFALGITLQALWQWTTPPVALALWAVLVLSLRDFFLPTTYRFSAEGVAIEGPLKIAKRYPWRRFRCFVKDRNGLFLSPYKARRASEGHRGVFLPLRPEQRELAREVCQSYGLEQRA